MSSLFNLSITTGLTDAGNFLSAGIHTAKFISLTPSKITGKDGTEYNVASLTLDVDGFGEWSHNFFEPKSAERSQGTYGTNPSQLEHFMVALREILDAVDMSIGEAIDKDAVQVNGKPVNTKNLDFIQLIKLCDILTKPYTGKQVQIKLVPQSNGFNDFPGFPARINKAGLLGRATVFIGSNLTLSQSEQKKIEAAVNNKPTNMATKDTSLSDIEGLLGDNGSDLPF